MYKLKENVLPGNCPTTQGRTSYDSGNQEQYRPVRTLIKLLGEGMRESWKNAKTEWKQEKKRKMQEAENCLGQIILGPFWEFSQIYGKPQKGETVEMIRDPESGAYVMKR